MTKSEQWSRTAVLNLWAVGRGTLPGGPRPRLGIENFLCESQSMKRYQVLVVELDFLLHT